MNGTRDRLLAEVQSAHRFARHAYTDLDGARLDRAMEEAQRLAASGLFDADLMPDIVADQYGEFTFSHESPAGYIDIGVRGVGELSYHVRNDKDPAATRYDDHKWGDGRIPQELAEAIAALRRHLEAPEDASSGQGRLAALS